MTSWQTLMALSATHTRRTEEAVQSQLAERQRREAQRRKEIEEKEKKERELEAKLRLKRLEEQKREQERAERLERERQATEREMRRRQDQERDALLYGRPKKARDRNGYPVSGAGAGAGAGKRRHSAGSGDDEPGPSNVLTREEKRQRALERELGIARGSGKRTSGGGAYRKPGRRLPGGAVDSVTTNSASSSQGSPVKLQSTRDRLKSEPAMLIKLNTNKRDTRTIDEIMTDRAKMRQGKVLDGESAKEFNDWFGKTKKDPPKKPLVPAASSSTSRANTPAVAGSGSVSPRPVSSGPFKSIQKFATPASKSSAALSAKVGSASKPPVSKAASAKPAASGSRTPTIPKTSSATTTNRSIPKKRRSPSLSDSPPPAKRRPAPGGSRHDEDDISSQIWKLFGKDRSSYIERDVLSDDEDMEADAFDVEREELRSTRIAKKEDELAMQEEKRREEEKKRKRKEKEKRGNY